LLNSSSSFCRAASFLFWSTSKDFTFFFSLESKTLTFRKAQLA
jgi:hypothetical protein